MNRFVFILFFVLRFNSQNFAANYIPFSLSWDDSTKSITNVSDLLEKPAGKYGFIRAQNDSFVDGEGNPFRILGINTAFSGNFPTHNQAEKISAHIAKYGINAVRIHHLDTSRSPNGIWLDGTNDKQRFDPEMLDRLDYFIAQLKKNGIYTNINLKVGRKTIRGDQVPFADELPTYDKGPDHFYPRLIELQQNYARDLLTHVNPYTGNNYLNEPAIVTIEINNESGLVSQWSNRSLDQLPQPYLQVLQNDWNTFLQKKYNSTDALKKAWEPQSTGDGKEMLIGGLDAWVLQTLEQAKGSKLPGDPLQFTIDQTSNQSWHVQILYPQIQVKQSEYYQVSMSLKADPPRTISITLQQDHSPWQPLDQSVEISLTNDWRDYTFSFSPNATDHQARLTLSGLANQTGTLWLANPSMKNQAPEILHTDASVENGTVPVVLRNDYSAKTAACKRDWMEFLITRETQYNQEMYDFLKYELGAKSMITGTQIGFAPYTTQLMHDLIDTHGYFNHPNFPNRQWDMNDWYVENESIVSQQDNVLQQLMERQVAGMPFTVSEYNHPAPMPFASEVIPLSAAYAAFQGWDGIYFFAYSHNNNYENKSINSFFDIAGHTPKMLCMPAAANMFIRGDVYESTITLTNYLSNNHLIDFLTDNSGNLWNLQEAHTGFKKQKQTEDIYSRYKTVINLETEKKGVSISGLKPGTTFPSSPIQWNNNQSIIIRSSKTKGALGFLDNQTIDLSDGLILSIGTTQENWANVLLTWMKTSDEGEHWLLTATGYSENQGMKWKDEQKNSVGRNWGDGPPLVEPVPLQIKIPVTSISQPALAYPLDEKGHRIQNSVIQLKHENKSTLLRLNSDQSSLWYEIVIP